MIVCCIMKDSYVTGGQSTMYLRSIFVHNGKIKQKMVAGETAGC